MAGAGDGREQDLLWCVFLSSFSFLFLPFPSPIWANQIPPTGRCGSVDKAFAEAAGSLASVPAAKELHLASVNCDDEPVLCNSWSANAGNLWLFQVLPAPAPVEIYTRRTNLTTVTTDEVVKAATAADRIEAGWHLFSAEGFFHPFEGKLAKLGLSVPLGYFFWALNAIPSWGLMLIVSFISRSMM